MARKNARRFFAITQQLTAAAVADACAISIELQDVYLKHAINIFFTLACGDDYDVVMASNLESMYK